VAKGKYAYIWSHAELSSRPVVLTRWLTWPRVDVTQAWPRLQCQLYDFNSELLKNLRGQYSMGRVQAAEIEKLKEKLGEVEGVLQHYMVLG
jgi:hypothetical protein